MAARFQAAEPLDQAFMRVAAEEIAAIRAGLAASEDDPDTAVHRARRGVKRLRALLRLARPTLGGDFAKANKRWRDAGRSLAGRRDAAVMLGTFDKVVALCGQELPPKQVTAIRTRLALDSTDAAGPKQGAVSNALDRAERALGKLRWPRNAGDLYKGLKLAQQRLRLSRETVCKQPDSENLHEWRKRLKDDAAQAGLLRAVLPEPLAVRREASGQLAEILGEEHDLAMLQGKLGELTAPRGTRNARDRLMRAIAEKREELCRSALAGGDALSRPKPKALARELVACWTSAHEEAVSRARNGKRQPGPRRARSRRPP